MRNIKRLYYFAMAEILGNASAGLRDIGYAEVTVILLTANKSFRLSA
jgi:hypothetical protein